MAHIFATVVAMFFFITMAKAEAAEVNILADLQKSAENSFSRCPQVADANNEDLTQLMSDWLAVTTAAQVNDVYFQVSNCARHGFAVTVDTKKFVVIDLHIAAMPRDVRYFIMAHELGHLVGNDWDSLRKVATDISPSGIVADSDFNRFMVMLKIASHNFEFAADKYAAQVLSKLGVNAISALDNLFFKLGHQEDSITHPASEIRLAKLRAHSSLN